MSYKLEICVGSINSALIAQAFGADRIELCDNLSEGGTTPSYGMIVQSKSQLTVPFFPIIRPRGGDFVFSRDEFQIMREDVLCCREMGCEGIVIGILRKDSTIDMERCAELIALSGEMEITFHRAFDRCISMERALEDLVELGCHRVLTSGGKEFAADGTEKLRSLVRQAGFRINIMPGSGISHRNLQKIAAETGAYEFHTTAKKLVENSIDPISAQPYRTIEADGEHVKMLKDILKQIGWVY
ncbi:MAG: copper homeostasis protein CutC [Daejeonella sp.]|uniref:copper homeostasis protein CutC n=1 Tax=Daejeonella sp. TaxID=2805397 RepID=UPI0027324014|nr:copper homeostasis protein CutC [Daejeonella sp.]MDP3467018.1 copper homeostasis protein CutC [Daejeonella sp.]